VSCLGYIIWFTFGISSVGQVAIWKDKYWRDRTVAPIIFGFLGLLIIFIDLKVAEAIDWSWFSVMIPSYLAYGTFLIQLFLFFLPSFYGPAEDYSFFYKVTPRKSAVLVTLFWYSVYIFFGLVPLLAFQVLLADHLENDGERSWRTIFIPIFIIEGIVGGLCFLLHLASCSNRL